MRQIIPFEKDIVFKSKIASITSISLEHEEKVLDGEVSGDFIVYGDYKIHVDTTEKELFKYRLPYTAMLSSDVVIDSVKVDIENFTYEVIDEDVLRVKIDYVLECDVQEKNFVDEFERFLEENEVCINDNTLEERDIYLNDSINNGIVINDEDIVDNVIETNVINQENTDIDIQNEEEVNIANSDEEYIIYHIYIVQEGDTISDIMKLYDVTIDDIAEYNDINSLNVGTKLIIPEVHNE